MQLDWTAILVTLLGGGGLVMGLFNAIKDSVFKHRNNLDKDIAEIRQKLINDYNHFEELEKKVDILSESISDLKQVKDHEVKGIMLGLENDAVIFEALKTHHINGESEAQKQKMGVYFKECIQETMGGRL